MSETKTMFTATLLTLNGDPLNDVECKPGDMVRFMFSSSTGTIVRKISDNQVVVLWGDFCNPLLDTLGRS